MTPRPTLVAIAALVLGVVAAWGVIFWAVPGPVHVDTAAPCPDVVSALRSVTFRQVCSQMQVAPLQACLAKFLQQLQGVLHRVSEFCGGRAASDAWTVLQCWAVYETLQDADINATAVGRHLHTMWAACGSLARACGVPGRAVVLGHCHFMLEHLVRKVGWHAAPFQIGGH